jgi:hypothetical protein
LTGFNKPAFVKAPLRIAAAALVHAGAGGLHKQQRGIKPKQPPEVDSNRISRLSALQ